MRLGRAGLLLACGVVAWLCTAAPAGAQFSAGGHRERGAPVLFQADEVQYDDQFGLTIAKGHVEISQGGEVLLAAWTPTAVSLTFGASMLLHLEDG